MASDPQVEMFEYRRARFATRLPTTYLYTPSHFWLGPQSDGLWRVGLTKLATRMLGEMVDYGFGVEAGAGVASGQVIGWIEGFKAISDLFCVGSGSFAGANPALEQDVTLINQDPYANGWLYAIKGTPDTDSVGVQAYAQLLDKAIDQLMEPPAQ